MSVSLPFVDAFCRTIPVDTDPSTGPCRVSVTLKPVGKLADLPALPKPVWRDLCQRFAFPFDHLTFSPGCVSGSIVLANAVSVSTTATPAAAPAVSVVSSFVVSTHEISVSFENSTHVELIEYFRHIAKQMFCCLSQFLMSYLTAHPISAEADVVEAFAISFDRAQLDLSYLRRSLAEYLGQKDGRNSLFKEIGTKNLSWNSSPSSSPSAGAALPRLVRLNTIGSASTDCQTLPLSMLRPSEFTDFSRDLLSSEQQSVDGFSTAPSDEKKDSACSIDAFENGGRATTDTSASPSSFPTNALHFAASSASLSTLAPEPEDESPQAVLVSRLVNATEGHVVKVIDQESVDECAEKLLSSLINSGAINEDRSISLFNVQKMIDMFEQFSSLTFSVLSSDFHLRLACEGPILTCLIVSGVSSFICDNVNHVAQLQRANSECVALAGAAAKASKVSFIIDGTYSRSHRSTKSMLDAAARLSSSSNVVVVSGLCIYSLEQLESALEIFEALGDTSTPLVIQVDCQRDDESSGRIESTTAIAPNMAGCRLSELADLLEVCKTECVGRPLQIRLENFVTANLKEDVHGQISDLLARLASEFSIPVIRIGSIPKELFANTDAFRGLIGFLESRLSRNAKTTTTTISLTAEPGSILLTESEYVAMPIFARRLPTSQIENNDGGFPSEQQEEKKLTATTTADNDNAAEEVPVLYYVADGIYGSFGGRVFQNKVYHPRPFSTQVNDQSKQLKAKIFGQTCDGLDAVVDDVTLPLLKIGDWLIWRLMGGSAHPTQFNGFEFRTRIYCKILA